MKYFAIILQVWCLTLVVMALFIMYDDGAEISNTLITSASVLFAISTKLNKIALKREIKHLTKKGQGYD